MRNTDLNEVDQGIIALFNGGSPDAFAIVFEILYASVYGFASRLAGKDNAADLTVDAFIQLWKHEKNFPDLNKIRTFLQVCVRNASFNLNMKRSCRENAIKELAYLQGGWLENSGFEEIKGDLLAALKGEIDKLPPGARKILKLSYFRGLNSNQVASILKISRSTVRNQKKRAIMILRVALKRAFHLH